MMHRKPASQPARPLHSSRRRHTLWPRQRRQTWPTIAGAKQLRCQLRLAARVGFCWPAGRQGFCAARERHSHAGRAAAIGGELGAASSPTYRAAPSSRRAGRPYRRAGERVESSRVEPSRAEPSRAGRPPATKGRAGGARTSGAGAQIGARGREGN